MRKYKILIYFFLILIQTTYSYSQNIAYANLDLIIQNSEVGKKIISYFSDKNEKNYPMKLVLSSSKKLAYLPLTIYFDLLSYMTDYDLFNSFFC